MEKDISPELRRKVKKAAELFDDFERSDLFRDYITGDHTYVLLPNDNPDQARLAMGEAQIIRQEGKDVLVIKAFRSDSGHYTKFAVDPSDEAEGNL